MNAAFYKEQSVIDFIKELLDITDDKLKDPLTLPSRRKVSNSLRKIKVMAKIIF